MKVWWCLEHSASFQMEADPNPLTWGCYASEPMTCLLCEGSGLRAYISPRTVETGESEFVSCGRCLGSGFVKTVPQAEDCRMVEMQLVPADALVVIWEQFRESILAGWLECMPLEHIDAQAAWNHLVAGGNRASGDGYYGLFVEYFDEARKAWEKVEEPPKDPWDYDP